MKDLERCTVEQSNEDAKEIIQIIGAAFVDCRMSKDLRQRIAAAKERAERIVRNIVRNTEITP